MNPQHILFIVNPISGSRPGRFQSDLVHKYLDANKFTFEIYKTKKENDGYKKVKKRLKQYDGFVAVGGDGTVNEVFKALIGTNKWFSVIPNGSGNGLARTLQIPMDIRKALQHLNQAAVQPIDFALLNGEPFINVAGIGFDARIASKFRKSTTRGLRSYAEITLQELKKMKTLKIKLEIDGKAKKRRILMASFANSSQFGNNAHIAPNASLTDGKLHIVTMKPFHWLSIPYLTWRLFNRSIDKTKLYKEYIVDQATITSSKNIHLHIDGEARGKVKRIHLEIVPKGISVLA